MSPERVTILGDGQMALVAADALTATGARVTLWGHDAADLDALAGSRTSPRLEGFTLPETVVVEPDPRAALRDAGVVVSAIPTQFLRAVWTPLAGMLPENTPVVSVTKGVEIKTLLTPTRVIADALGEPEDRRAYAALSGPTIAHELARRLPATMVAASAHRDLAERVQCAFDAPWLRVYVSDDPLGVEIAGAVKNIIAIASGICDGLALGNNARASLIARGLVEMTRFVKHFGAKKSTFLGLSGAGDLFLTATSILSRNYRVGLGLAEVKALERILEELGEVAEGVYTAEAVEKIVQKEDIYTPIANEVYEILHGKDVRQSLHDLLTNRRK